MKSKINTAYDHVLTACALLTIISIYSAFSPGNGYAAEEPLQLAHPQTSVTQSTSTKRPINISSGYVGTIQTQKLRKEMIGKLAKVSGTDVVRDLIKSTEVDKKKSHRPIKVTMQKGDKKSIIPTKTLPKREEKRVAIKKESGKTFIANISAYTAAFDETDSGDGITASGKRVKTHHTIACPRTYAFGTQIKVEGYGTYTCEDRGGAIKGHKFDIYMETKAEAFAFGRRNLTVTVLQ